MRQPRMTVPYGTWLVVSLLQRTDTFIQTITEEFSLVDRDLGIDHIDEALTVDLFRRDDGQMRHGGKLFTVANQLNTPELIDDLAADLVNGLGQPALLLGGKLVPGLAGGIDRDTLISVVKLLPSARRRWTGWD